MKVSKAKEEFYIRMQNGANGSAVFSKAEGNRITSINKLSLFIYQPIKEKDSYTVSEEITGKAVIKCIPKSEVTTELLKCLKSNSEAIQNLIKKDIKDGYSSPKFYNKFK